MPLLNHFDPPASLGDFDAIPGQREGWSKFISSVFDDAIKRVEEEVGTGNSQYYNETKVASDAPEDLDIVWDAFPKTLIRRFGRTRALQIADGLDQSPVPGLQSRVQDEYCEWRVIPVPDNTSKILRVIFTCEGPEYWSSLAGGQNNIWRYDFGDIGNKQILLEMYRSILNNQDVELEDLFFPDAPEIYNPWNKWNTTHGIVHLQQRNNTLGAEITIGADATIRRKKGGEEITQATRLICCGGFGEVERSSDPTMGDEINKLAREGYALTLRNPVGIYFHSFDNSGFTKPGPNNTRVPAGNYLKPLRGTFQDPFNHESNMVVRAVYEVPAGELGPDGEQLTVSDIHIGGVPIIFGGHIAECIRMKFIARRTRPGQISNPAFECRTKCCRQNGILQAVPLDASCADFFPVTPAPGPMMVVAATDFVLPQISFTRRPISE